MALAAPGAENPSPAYLAGAAHGAALAVQHHAAATSTPTVKTAAPKGAAVTSTDPTLNDLLSQARSTANQQTQAQVNAIKGEQGQYVQDAQQQAQQIIGASQAASQLLNSLGLGTATANSYNQAAQTIGSLGQGFSGQTGTDAQNAAAAVQANLAKLGAPVGSLQTATGQTSNPAALQNVLYGVNGFIPGSLLATLGPLQAGVQNALPASLLSQGQTQAAGTVAAGRQQAQSLTPNIVNAEANLPALYQSILASLASTANTTALDQSLIGSRANTATYQQGELANNQVKTSNTYTLGEQKIAATAKAAATKAAAAKALKPLTSTEKQKAASLAYNIASVAYSGGTDKKGNPLKPLSYGGALEEMRSEGLLADPRTAALAVNALNQTYQTNAPAASQIDHLAQAGIKPSGPAPTKRQKTINSTLFPSPLASLTGKR